MAVTRVFLHVGSPKTGTSFLQSVLWSQRDRAREQGLLLPLTSLRDHHHAMLDARDITHRAPDPARAIGLWQRAVEESLSWQGDVLISHELLAGATVKQANRAVRAFGDGVELHVVLTARDLVRQIPAEWQEHVKHRNPITYLEFLESISGPKADTTWFWRVQDAPKVLRRWTRHIPSERSHLVTVPPPGSPAELLWRRFASLLGLDADAFELPEARKNTSLGLEQTELLRAINAALGERLPNPGPYPEVVKSRFARGVLAQREGTPLRLPDEYRDFAVRRADTMVKELADMGVDVVGDLADLAPPASAGTEAMPLELTRVPDSVLLAESIEVLIGLIEADAERHDGEPRGGRTSAVIARTRRWLGRCRHALGRLKRRIGT